MKRKRKKKAAILILFFAAVLVLVLVSSYARSVWKEKQKQQSAEILSGIQVDLNVLDSPYAVLLDSETGQVLASKRGDERIFPASMVKMMTVLTAIEEIRDLDAYTEMAYDIYDELYAQDASRAGFEPGESVRIRELLYGALLPSGAECCIQLAREAAGTEEAFVAKMNEKAQKLGLAQTNFTNVTGLHDENQYSTPHEMGKILQTALKNKTFYQVITTHHYATEPSNIHPDGFTFWSTMFKNMKDEIVNGGEIIAGKTGYTDEAGHCLSSAAKINNRLYILVTAGWAQNTDNSNYHISDAFLAYDQIAPQ